MPILSGLDESGVYPTNFNTDVELFTPSADMNGRGTVSLVGSRGGSGQPPEGGNYPHMFSMPSGRMLIAGPFPDDSWFLNPPGSELVHLAGRAEPAARPALGHGGPDAGRPRRLDPRDGPGRQLSRDHHLDHHRPRRAEHGGVRRVGIRAQAGSRRRR